MIAQPLFQKHKIRLLFATSLKMLHNFTDNEILITYVIEIKKIIILELVFKTTITWLHKKKLMISPETFKVILTE